MSSQPEQPVSVGSGLSGDVVPGPWQRLLALSGVAFAVLFVVGWFASGGDAPDYGASDQDWVDWADDNQWKSRIGAFAMLLAGFVFLDFAATIRTAPPARAGGIYRQSDGKPGCIRKDQDRPRDSGH